MTDFLNSLQIRPAKMDDRYTVLQLMQEQNEQDFGEALVSEKDLIATWQQPGFDLERDTWIVHTDNGQLAGYAVLLQQNDTNFLPVVFLSQVNRCSEIGKLLIGKVETRALRKTKCEKNVSFSTQVGDSNQALKHVFEASGYEIALSFLTMEIFLEELPKKSNLPADISIRDFVQGQDEWGTFQADEEASQDKSYHSTLQYEEWVKRMSYGRKKIDPTYWYLACQQKEIVGVALNYLANESNTGWIDHLGVRRQWRKRDIGKSLMIHSFRKFYQDGVKHIKLNVDSKSLTNATKLYESVGMRTVQKYHVFNKEVTL
jgi:mycothiol synthase